MVELGNTTSVHLDKIDGGGGRVLLVALTVQIFEHLTKDFFW